MPFPTRTDQPNSTGIEHSSHNTHSHSYEPSWAHNQNATSQKATGPARAVESGASRLTPPSTLKCQMSPAAGQLCTMQSRQQQLLSSGAGSCHMARAASPWLGLPESFHCLKSTISPKTIILLRLIQALAFVCILSAFSLLEYLSLTQNTIQITPFLGFLITICLCYRTELLCHL